MKNCILLLAFYFLLSSPCFADNLTAIKAINKKVSDIEKLKGGLSSLELKLDTEATEAVPPEMVFYYSPESMELLILQVTVGHEVFSTRHTYYLNNNRVIKYLKEIDGRSDSPPKSAIIYNDKGVVLWKNITEPVVSVSDVVSLFKFNFNTLKQFSKY